MRVGMAAAANDPESQARDEQVYRAMRDDHNSRMLIVPDKGEELQEAVTRDEAQRVFEAHMRSSTLRETFKA